MFKDRDQRIAVVKTIFGAFNKQHWINGDGLTPEALFQKEEANKNRPVNLSHSAEWMFRLGLSFWDNSTWMYLGKLYHLDGRNRRIMFSLLHCFENFEKQDEAIETWLFHWRGLREPN